MEPREMTSTENSLVLQIDGRAPPPSRDYYSLVITETEVTLNCWKVTYGPQKFPSKRTSDLRDLSKDFLDAVSAIYGEVVVNFLTSLAKGERVLLNLPKRAFFKVLENLSIKDILNFGMTSVILHRMCDANEVWKLIFIKYFEREPYKDEVRAAMKVGWKELLKTKMLLKKAAIAKARNPLR